MESPRGNQPNRQPKKTMKSITIMTGYHKDQEINFVETPNPQIYKRTQDGVQSSFRGSIQVSDKWLVTFDKDRQRVFKTRKQCLEFLDKVDTLNQIVDRF